MGKPTTFQTAVIRRFGPPEVISIEQYPVPTSIPANAVVVATRSAGVNPVDARIRSGSFGGSVPYIPGRELAGTVVAVGSRVRFVSIGDDVIGFGVPSAHAELVITPESNLAPKPPEVDWAVAGGISGVGQTAIMSIDAVAPSSDDVVVIHGAAGGVGSILVQLLVNRGITVIGTASKANQDYLASLGAIPVTYGPGVADRIANAAPRPDTISIDLAGTSDAGDIATSVVSHGGQAVTLVPETASSHGIKLLHSQPTRDKLVELLARVADGTLQLPVDQLPFKDIVAAHQRLEAKHSRGKLVLEFTDNPHLPD